MPAGITELQLCLLGAPALVRPGLRVELPATVPSLVLACLACEGGWVGREALATRLWPDARPDESQRRLRVTLFRARQWLQQSAGAGAALQSERQRIRLALADDVTRFRQAVADGRYADAAALHRAPLLQGLSAADFPDLDQYFTQLRSRLLAEWRHAAVQHAGRLIDDGRARDAVRLLRAVLETDLLAEDVLQALLRAAAAAPGEAASALAAHARFEERLHVELGVSPLTGTQALAAALRAGQPPLPEAVTTAPPWAPSGAADDRAPYLPPQAQRQRLQTSTARLLLVHGVAGAGKSRLLAEAWPGAVRWTCLEAQQTTPLAPLQPYLSALGSRLRRDVPEPALRRELARLLPDLSDGEQLPTAEPGQGPLVGAWVKVLPRWLDRLVVDDLQWADPATLQLLQGLVAAGEVQVAAAARTEALPSLQSLLERPGVETIEVPALSSQDVERWLHGVSGRTAPALALWLHRVSAGNPLLLGQWVQALRDDGPLRTADGAWPADLDACLPACAGWPLPDRVLAVLHRRLDSLPDDLQRVLQALAVWGEAADPAVLSSLTGLTPAAVTAVLQRAQQSGWVVGGRLAHDLLREAVVCRMPERPLRRLHDAAARADLEAPADRADPHRRAAHWWAAGDEAAAVRAELEAGQRDRQRGLHTAALPRLQAAEDRCTHADERVSLATLQGWLWLELGDAERAVRCAERALARDPSAGRLAELWLLMAQGALERGRVDEVAQLLDRAARLQPDHPEVLSLTAHVAMLQGDLPRMARAVERVLEASVAWPSADQADAMVSHSAVLAQQGRMSEAARVAREALERARRCRARFIEVGAIRNLVAILSDLGQLDEAVALGLQGLALGEYKGTAVLKNNLGRAYKRMQRWEDAAALFSSLTADRDPSMRCYAWGHLIDVQGRRGAADALQLAIDAGLAALERTDQPPARHHVLQAVLLHGDTAAVRRAEAVLAADRGPLPPALVAARAQALERVGSNRPGG